MNARLMKWLPLLAVAGLGLVSCRKQAAPDEAASDAANRQVFQGRGVIKQVAPAEQRVVIAHEEITNYMAAMTMPFHVRDTNELAGLKPGDAVRFQYVVLPEDDWVENLRREDAVPAAAAPSPTLALPPVVELFRVGDALPAVTFTNHHGQVVALVALRGQALALGFFYSRCPVAELCPRQTAEFVATARQLATNAAAPANWRMLCFTLDPEHDTPEALNAVAQAIAPTESRIEFLTGAVLDLQQLAARCGVIAMPESNSIRHNLRVVVVDSAGRVQNLFKGGHWTPEELADALTRAAAVTVSPAP